MRNAKPYLLSKPLFLLALGLMLLNDFYLKYAFSNFFTGKLSDIAGLFLFPYFLSAFRVRWAKLIYIGTALLFVFWKSPYSQDLINLVQRAGIGFNRVVDYTDLFALFILPVSYSYFQKQLLIERSEGKYLTFLISVITLFAIWATTLPSVIVDLNLDVNETYEIPIGKADLFNEILAAHEYSFNLERNLSDSLFYLYFDIGDKRHSKITALVTITSVDRKNTRVVFNKILEGRVTGRLFQGVKREDVEYLKSISAEEFKMEFEKNVIAPLKEGKAAFIHYDNKELRDSYRY